MMKPLFVVIALIGLSAIAKAEVKTYTQQKQTFSLDLPKGWIDAENVVGTPVTFWGPEAGDEKPRTVISFYPTGQEDKKNFLDGAKKAAALYKEKRLDWLKGVFGEATDFDQFKEDKWTGVEKAYFFGYHYEIPAGKFYERSVYVACGGNRVFNIKSTVPEEFEADHNKLVEQTIKSLKCEKTPIKTAKN